MSVSDSMTMSLADPMLPQPYRIRRVRRETRETFTLALEPEAGGEIMEFAPGQFNMLYLFGVGEVPISISGDPAQRARLTHTIRAVGTVTRAMQRLKRGAVLGVRGPFGSHWPIAEAAGHDVLLIAGGLGLVPLLPVWHHLLAHRARYGRIVLLYGARAPRDVLFPRQLERWQRRADADVELTVDATATAWRGHVGVVTTLVAKARFDPARTVAMVCGPEVMMRYVTVELRKRGVASERLFLSLERNLKCAIGFCGHCQYGPHFICKDGPVLRYDRIAHFFKLRGV
jgi:NAD(P)H-flavin reductase